MVNNLAAVDAALADDTVVTDDAAVTDALSLCGRTFMFGNIIEKAVPGHWGQQVQNTAGRWEWVL